MVLFLKLEYSTQNIYTFKLGLPWVANFVLEYSLNITLL